MVSRTRTLLLSGLLLVVPCALAQTVTTIVTEQDTLSTIIPGTCSTTCATWLTSLGACPSTPDTTAATTDYNTCVCDAAFVTAFTTCSACMTTALTAATDPQLALPATALADLTAYCATVAGGTAATTAAAAATTTTTTTTTAAVASPTTTAAAASPTTNAASPVAASPTVSSSSTTPFNTTPTAVIITSVFQGQGFPTQTKSVNVFTGDAQGRVQVALGALLVAAGAIWFV